MKDKYSEYLLFQKNEYIQKLVNAGIKYWEGCVDGDEMPTMDGLTQFSENDFNLLSEKEFDKITKEEER